MHLPINSLLQCFKSILFFLVLVSAKPTLSQSTNDILRHRLFNLELLWGKLIKAEDWTFSEKPYIELHIMFGENETLPSDVATLTELSRNAARIYRQCVMESSSKRPDSIAVFFMRMSGPAHILFKTKFCLCDIEKDTTDHLLMLRALASFCSDSVTTNFTGSRLTLNLYPSKTSSVSEKYLTMQAEVFGKIAALHILGGDHSVQEIFLVTNTHTKMISLNTGYSPRNPMPKNFENW